jgi:hypothetical protein
MMAAELIAAPGWQAAESGPPQLQGAQDFAVLAGVGQGLPQLRLRSTPHWALSVWSQRMCPYTAGEA